MGPCLFDGIIIVHRFRCRARNSSTAQAVAHSDNKIKTDCTTDVVGTDSSGQRGSHLLSRHDRHIG